MLVSELLVERRLQRTRIMYHGTSSVFLPSIMKYGLIPDSPHKSFGTNAWASYGGVYLTSKPAYARKATKFTVETHGGDPILITVQLVVGSGGLDEDLVTKRFAQIGFEFLFTDYRNNIKENLSTFLKKTLPKAIRHFSRHAKPTEYTKQYIQEYFELFYSHVTEINYPNLIGMPELREQVTKIIESVKDQSTMPEVRVLRPIKFKGKTRIIQIYNLKTRKILYTENSN